MWVVDFPMFEETDGGALTALHHPFTAPTCTPEELEVNPSQALSRAYDMVLNGYEVGGVCPYSPTGNAASGVSRVGYSGR